MTRGTQTYPNFILCFRGMFNKEKIAKLKKGVLIVNNARGAIMDTQAVADACSSGHIAGTLKQKYCVVDLELETTPFSMF